MKLTREFWHVKLIREFWGQDGQTQPISLLQNQFSTDAARVSEQTGFSSSLLQDALMTYTPAGNWEPRISTWKDFFCFFFFFPGTR